MLLPVEWPVSCSSVEYKCFEYFLNWVEVSDLEPNVTIKPAACHVVPKIYPALIKGLIILLFAIKVYQMLGCFALKVVRP